jgi:ribosomal-protein-alanine N-acetyltransferase
MNGMAATDETAPAAPPFPELETARLRLCRITMDEADWFLRHFSVPEIVFGQGHAAPKDLEDAREQLALYIVDLFAGGGGLRWGIALMGSDVLIGSAGLYDWDREVRSAEAGYDLDPSHWGRGIMTEAMIAILDYGFDVMELNRVQVLAMPRNGRSLRLAERLGFVREGVLRDHGHDETGALCDDVVLSLLSHEWRARTRRGSPG